MIIAGEISGDMHAARVVQAVRDVCPGATFYGVGGERMREVGVDTSYDVGDMAVVGFAEVVRRLAFFRRVFREMVDLAYRRKPDAIILVDYPGFNLRFAARAHAMGFKVIYYICPQVWAWCRSRIPKMAAIVDRLITIFPFEEAHFRGTHLDVKFAGHPLVDEARALLESPERELPWGRGPGVALLPGSRTNEIEKLLPVMWGAAAILEQRRPELGFIVAAPSDREASLIGTMIEELPNGPTRCSVVTTNTRQVLRQARAAMVASGTATIEAALMGCPMVVAYKVVPLTYLLGKLLVKVPHIGMVNIVAGKQVCPEFIQGRATPKAIAAALDPLLDDGPERTGMIEELAVVANTLGPGRAAYRTAELILEVVRT